MDWVEFVRQNQTILNLRFRWSKPRHPKHEWRGEHTRQTHLWLKHGKERWYIPISMFSDAGYIDLYSKSYVVTSDAEGSENKLKEAYAYLSEHAG